jgi:hypothetical protein
MVEEEYKTFVTKKKGTHSIRTPWQYLDPDAGLIFEVPTLTHGS